MDRRRAQRSRTLKIARIAFNRRGSVLDCTLRNVSPLGACVQIVTPLGIPQEFDLVLADNSIHPARTVWRTNRQLGLEFEDEDKPAPHR